MFIQESPVRKVLKPAPSAGSRRKNNNNRSLTTYEWDYSMGSLRGEDDQPEEQVTPVYLSPPREHVIHQESIS